jgi:hypothetical protein
MNCAGNWKNTKGPAKLSPTLADPSKKVGMTLPELYAGYQGSRGSQELARTLIKQSDWFCAAAEFDPKTGQALPQPLSSVLAKIAMYAPPRPGEPVRDRLWRIAEHSRDAVERLLHALNESPRREHAMLPVHMVRELDATSFIKLSNRPGRTMRDKLAGNPYLQAVRRFQSVDLPENRLLKAFVIRLADLLELRRDCLGHEDALLSTTQAWLLSDAARGIARWENLPPNNTLLSHRDYRRIWDAWSWLQSLDDDISSDLTLFATREKTVRLWTQCAQMWSGGKFLFAETPLLFDYKQFEILPWPAQPPLFTEEKRHISRQLQNEYIVEPACIDLTLLRPRYATASGKSACALPAAFLWQHWKRPQESIDIGLFNSDAAYLHPDATSISSSDLFFGIGNTFDDLNRAARAFASRLRGIFRHDTLIWLAPDVLNDFELKLIRRNLNALFPDAEPLPRSIAAAFERVDYSRISDGFAIVVIDVIGGTTCVTKLLARFDRELKIQVPETLGFYWERHPPIIVASAAVENSPEPIYNMVTVDESGQWRSATRPVKPEFIDSAILRRDPRIGQFALAINLAESPVSGGVRLHELQQRASDIPLWRDQVPELSIKVMKDGRLQRFHLVARGTTVKPIRGMPVTIDVDEDFTLLAGKSDYRFPLSLGESADDAGFSARLDSAAFPLNENAVCQLHLTFEYGADDPYQLVFMPRCKSFPPIRATWRRTEDIVVTDAPAPEYPAPMTWADLRRMPKPGGNETSDLLEWVARAIVQLDEEVYIRPKPRTTGTISGEWRTDKKGGHFTLATCDAMSDPVFIHASNLVPGLDYTSLRVGVGISFERQQRDGKYSGRKVAGPGYTETERPRDLDVAAARSVAVGIRKRLYFPVIQVWRDGRSIRDQECLENFAAEMQANIAYLAALLGEDDLPEQVKHALRFLLSCMHKDAADECVRWIVEQVDDGNLRDKQAIGFALGDVSEQWQRNVLSKLTARPTSDVLRVLAYAIWREQHFIDRFSLKELQSVLNVLETVLGSIKPCPTVKDNRATSSWTRATVEPLELLLGLLRTRSSSDPDIKMLLQSHQTITKQLSKQVERVTEIVATSQVDLFSRVQINLQKPEGDHTPNLLYALRLYLTGDDGANMIHISSISDNDND